MRVPWLVCLLATTALTGCMAAPENQGDDGDAGRPMGAVDPAWANTSRIPFLEGTYRWHDATNDPADAYDAVTQNVAQPCLFQGDDQERPEPYFNNLQLTPDGPPEQPVVPGTTDLEATLSWTETDWAGEQLFLTWIGGDAERYRVAGPVANAEPTLLPILNETWNRNGTTNWDVWVCLTDREGAPEHTTFAGTLDVRLDLARVRDI